jgi:hypothetical protein
LNERFVARYVVWKLFLLGAAAMGFVAIGWLMVTGGLPTAPKWVGWLSFLFFGPTSVLIFTMLFDRRPQIMIDGKGIYYRRWSDDVIAWDDVVRVAFFTISQNAMMGVCLIDETRYPARKSWQSWLGRVNRGFGFDGITIATAGMNKSHEQLMQAVFQFAPPTVQLLRD